MLLFYIVDLTQLFPLFICCRLSFFCPESPKWLIVKGRKEEAIEGLNKLASKNKKIFQLGMNARFEEEMNATNKLSQS